MNGIRLLLTEQFPRSSCAIFASKVMVHAAERLNIYGEDNDELHRAFRYIIGELRCDAETKLFDDRDISQFSPVQLTKLGFASGSARLRVFPSLTLDEHFMIRTRAIGKQGQRAKWVDWAKERFSVLREVPKTVAGNFSGGEQQILMIALTLIGLPKLVVIEEPWMGLAHVASLEFGRAIEELQRNGTSFVLISQGTVGEGMMRSPGAGGNAETVYLSEFRYSREARSLM